MKFERLWTGNWANAIRGMRHPLESYKKSDSVFGWQDMCADDSFLNVIHAYAEKELPNTDYDDDKYDEVWEQKQIWLEKNGVLEVCETNPNFINIVAIGPNDLDLMQRLIKGGPEHAKFLRQIYVSFDITAPLYWWKEADTYKIATTVNSTSTMHKLMSKPITMDCFETDDLHEIIFNEDIISTKEKMERDVEYLEWMRQAYNENHDPLLWKELVRQLPTSWLQTRMWSGSYANLRTICHQRKGHKLSEWKQFIDFVRENIPYAEELIFFEN